LRGNCSVIGHGPVVLNKLKKINPNKSPGPDLLLPRVIYEVKEVIAYPIALLFNKSLSSGQLPEDWKYSLISTIHKKVSGLEQGITSLSV